MDSTLIDWKDNDGKTATLLMSLHIDNGMRIFILGCLGPDQIQSISKFLEHKNCKQCVILTPCSKPPHKGD